MVTGMETTLMTTTVFVALGQELEQARLHMLPQRTLTRFTSEELTEVNPVFWSMFNYWLSKNEGMPVNKHTGVPRIPLALVPGPPRTSKSKDAHDPFIKWCSICI